MAFRHRRRSPEQVRAQRILADAITIDGRKEWTCKFCSETNVWTRWRCRRCGNNIPSGRQGKHKQAMCAKNREWYSGSSSSSGAEEWKSQEQEEIKRLRAQVELLSRQHGAEQSPQEPRELARRGSGLEGCRMEFEEETEYKKKLDEQKKSLQRQEREIGKFANMDPVVRNHQKEVWKKELEEIERKRTELLPEHQKMQKKSQKLLSLRDKHKNHHKTAGECGDEMQKLNKGWRSREHRVRDAIPSLVGKVRLGRRVNKEEAAVRCSQMGAALMQPFWSNSSRWEQPRQCSRSINFREKSGERLVVNNGQSQPLRNEEREQKRGEEDWDEGERMANGWYENAAYGSVVDPAEGSDDVGGSLGGSPSTPRKGARARDGNEDRESDKMGDDGLP